MTETIIARKHHSLGDGQQFQLLVNAVVDYAIFMLDSDGNVLTWNPGAERIKGYAADEIIGRHFSQFYTAEDRAAGEPERALRTALTEGKYDKEAWRVRKDGTRFWAMVVIDPIRDEKGNHIGFAKVTRDMTERRRADEALRTSQEQFKLLIQGVTDYAIYMLDPSGKITNWNAGGQRIKGYAPDEIVGKHFSQFYTEEDREAGEPARALETAAREGRFEKEGWRVRKDGTRFWANVIVDAIHDDAGRLIGFAKVTRDMTEKRKAQDELEQARAALFQSQKTEALGQLTGGIAHDFNNLLTIIANNLDLLSHPQSQYDGQRYRRLVEGAQRAVERATRLTQQLLAFARRQPLRPEKHDINKLIGSFEAVLHRACGETVEMEISLARGSAITLVDAPQFEAALLNLLINARDAMPQGGRLSITTDFVDVDAKHASRMSGIAPGRYVAVNVADTGIGMTPEVAARVFEPFYTTKEVGKGTGLGLSQVYGFVTQSGGHVEIDSQIGRGTTVSLYLPAAEGAEAEDRSEHGEDAATSSAGTVLVVEDDPDVLQVAIETLHALGYDVLTAGDGVAALQMLTRDQHIDVLFSDIVMPRGMSGVELAHRARRIRPGLKVLLASGYPMTTLSAEHGLDSAFSFVSKPYRWTELQERLRQLQTAG
jgi:PAS domain S-box-containing protein